MCALNNDFRFYIFGDKCGTLFLTVCKDIDMDLKQKKYTPKYGLSDDSLFILLEKKITLIYYEKM